MIVYSTRYALTGGIEQIEAEETAYEGMLAYSGGVAGNSLYLHGEGKDWHRTHEAAVARAEAMRTAKIVSLKKQVAELEAMRFE